MKHAMFDIETLGLTLDVVVLTAGMVIFELPDDGGDYDLIDERLFVPSITEQVKMGRTQSQSTLKWWGEQSQEARDEAFSEHRISIPKAIDGLVEFCAKYGVVHYWAAPATFDFPIWESLVSEVYPERMASCVPWGYNKKHDVHTAVFTAGVSASDHAVTYEADGWRAGVPHAARWDCKRQIDLLALAFSKIRRDR